MSPEHTLVHQEAPSFATQPLALNRLLLIPCCYKLSLSAKLSKMKMYCLDRESNTGPQDLQSCALPTELSRQSSFSVCWVIGSFFQPYKIVILVHPMCNLQRVCFSWYQVLCDSVC